MEINFVLCESFISKQYVCYETFRRWHPYSNRKSKPEIRINPFALATVSKKFYNYLFDSIVCLDLSPIGIPSSTSAETQILVTDYVLKKCTNITFLDSVISDGAIFGLTTLTSLKLCYNNSITGYSIVRLKQLKELSLYFNDQVRYRIKVLTNLTSLSLGHNDWITDDCLSNLTNISTLSLSSNE